MPPVLPNLLPLRGVQVHHWCLPEEQFVLKYDLEAAAALQPMNLSLALLGPVEGHRYQKKSEIHLADLP